MPHPRAPRPSLRVLRGGHPLLLAALLGALAAAAPAAALGPEPALAQDKGGKERAKEDGKEEKREKSEEEVLLEAIGKQWKAGDAKGIGGRLPARSKVSLRLPGVTGGEYRREQALSLLEDYFGDRTFAKVELKSVKEEVGTFAVEYVRASDRGKVGAELVLTLGTEKRRRVLVGIRESP